MTDDPEIRRRAVLRLTRLRRLEIVAHKTTRGLSEELDDVRKDAARALGDFVSAATRAGYDRGARLGPAGQPIVMRTNSRRQADGSWDIRTDEAEAPEFAKIARRAFLLEARRAELQDLVTAASERWHPLGRLVDDAEKLLGELGWLDQDDPSQLPAILPGMGGVA